MVKLIVPSIDKVATKWVTEAPKRVDYYKEATPAAAPQWFANTTAAEATYKAAVTATGIEKRFVGGVKKAGAETFVRKVLSVGVDRYPRGIEAAKPEYEKGFGPFLEELGRVDVPERKPRGDPANYKRVETIGTALNKKRLALLAAGT